MKIGGNEYLVCEGVTRPKHPTWELFELLAKEVERLGGRENRDPKEFPITNLVLEVTRQFELFEKQIAILQERSNVDLGDEVVVERLEAAERRLAMHITRFERLEEALEGYNAKAFEQRNALAERVQALEEMLGYEGVPIQRLKRLDSLENGIRELQGYAHAQHPNCVHPPQAPLPDTVLFRMAAKEYSVPVTADAGWMAAYTKGMGDEIDRLTAENRVLRTLNDEIRGKAAHLENDVRQYKAENAELKESMPKLAVRTLAPPLGWTRFEDWEGKTWDWRGP